MPPKTPLSDLGLPHKLPVSQRLSCEPACSSHGRCVVTDKAIGPQCFCLSGYTGPTCGIAQSVKQPAIVRLPNVTAPAKPAAGAAKKAKKAAAKSQAPAKPATAPATKPAAAPAPTKPAAAPVAPAKAPAAAPAPAKAAAAPAEPAKAPVLSSLVEEAAYYDEDALWESEEDQHEDEMLMRALDQIIRV